MRAGRKIKTHTATYDSNLHIPGLSMQGKRWRVMTPIGKEVRYTEPDITRLQYELPLSMLSRMPPDEHSCNV